MKTHLHVVLALIVGISLFTACKKAPKHPQLERLGIANAIAQDFERVAPTLYDEDAELPELMSTFHPKRYSFMLRAEDVYELERLRKPIAELLRKHNVERIVLVLIGSKVIVNGKEYHQEDRQYIMGAYDLDASGVLTEREDTEEAMNASTVEDLERQLNSSPKK